MTDRRTHMLSQDPAVGGRRGVRVGRTEGERQKRGVVHTMVQRATTRVFSEGYSGSTSSVVCLAVAGGLLSTSAAASAAAAALFVAAPYSSASSACLSSAAAVSSCCSWRSRALRICPLRRRAPTPSTSGCLLWPSLRSATMKTDTGCAEVAPGSAPPELVAGASDFETLFGAYR